MHSYSIVQHLQPVRSADEASAGRAPEVEEVHVLKLDTPAEGADYHSGTSISSSYFTTNLKVYNSYDFVVNYKNETNYKIRVIYLLSQGKILIA